MADELHHHEHYGEAGERATEETHIHMPELTFWPMVFAFGVALLAAAMVTHWVVGVVGVVLMIRSGIGWWHSVIPHEEIDMMPIDPKLRPAPIMVEQRTVVRLQAGEGGHRVHMPETVHPYSSGLWGGLAGGVVMAILACLYGLVAEHSIWYPINLLAGVIIPGINHESIQQLRQFNALAFGCAFVGHGILSILVGIVYAVALPMFPRRATLWAGIVVPLFWSGLTATTLAYLNPRLNQLINWPWFIVCQIAYGLVAGYVISRSENIHLMQNYDLAQRAFMNAPGVRPENEDDRR
ncbi:MAG TPA: hypothetical protein VF283_18915 [Bryobacteraceae bacterium]